MQPQASLVRRLVGTFQNWVSGAQIRYGDIIYALLRGLVGCVDMFSVEIFALKDLVETQADSPGLSSATWCM